jgi:outer membrane protein OmpA-like peptidoglycan-associated protein
MSQHRVLTGLALVGAMSLLAGGAVLAQPPQPTDYWVSFPSGSVELHAADQETIHGVAAMMERDPNLVATVLGKTDAIGSKESNEHLSWRRASAVFEAMAFKYDVPSARMDMRWTGEHMQNVPTADEQAELQNRVVLIQVRAR